MFITLLRVLITLSVTTHEPPSNPTNAGSLPVERFVAVEGEKILMRPVDGHAMPHTMGLVLWSRPRFLPKP